jgi:hypothetical protein
MGEKMYVKMPLMQWRVTEDYHRIKESQNMQLLISGTREGYVNQPGRKYSIRFTTKRGWGLGLPGKKSRVSSGKIFVRSSWGWKSACIRIMMKSGIN